MRKEWTIYDLDSIQINKLTNIAYLNPIYGGVAVYAARVMLDIDLNDSLEEKSNSRIRNIAEEIVNISNSSDYTMHPNPANDEIIIRFNDLENEKVDLEIHNSLGSIVLSKKNCLINGKTLKLDVSHLNAGYYQVGILYAKKSFQFKQLIIIK
ncbi:hypothetical protein BH11BAC2_BH11BAC2_13070 [soil metagenome]